MEYNTRKNAFDALFYLVWTIVKQQWKILIGVLIFSLILIFLPTLIASNGGYDPSHVGVIGLFYTMPVLIITLVCVPMVHNQIFSSSISKRLKASGVSSKIYAIVIIALFALVAIVVFYAMSLLAWLIWHNSYFENAYWDYENDTEIISRVQVWDVKINYLSLILLTPISIFGLSSTGLLLGRIKISEIFKGVTIFFMIVIAILMSRTIMNPLNSDMAMAYDEFGVAYQPTSVITTFKILMLNPWGSMIYTMQHSFDSMVHAQVTNMDQLKSGYYTGVTATLVYTVITSLILILTSIFTIK